MAPEGLKGENKITAIQAALREEGIDAWLFYNFRGSNVFATRILDLPKHLMGSGCFEQDIEGGYEGAVGRGAKVMAETDRNLETGTAHDIHLQR